MWKKAVSHSDIHKITVGNMFSTISNRI